MSSPENTLADFRDQRISDEIKGIAAALEVSASGDNRKLSERIFVGVFLPFFAGDESPAYKVGVQHWINVSGSPFASVSIVNDRNQELFVVPPLYDRAAVQPVSEGGSSIAHVVASTAQLNNVHPSQGQAYLDAELTKRALVMKVPANVLHHIEVWNSIFARYGRPPIVAVDPQVAQTSTQAPDQGDDFDFQPL